MFFLALFVSFSLSPQEPAPPSLEQQVEEVEQLVRSGSGYARISTALLRIAIHHDKAAVEALADLLPSLSDQNQRYALLRAVAYCNAPEAARYLRNLASKSDTLEDRGYAMSVLAYRGEEQRKWIYKRMGSVRDSKLKAHMLRLLLHYEHPGLEKPVLAAAEQLDPQLLIQGLSGIGLLKLHRGFSAVKKSLGHASAEVRAYGMRTLAILGGRPAFQLLLDAWLDARNATFRDFVSRALMSADDRDEVEVLVRFALTDLDEQDVASMIDILSVIAHHQPDLVGPALLKLANNSRRELRWAAIRGIVVARPEGALKVLVQRLQNANTTTLLDTLWALAEIGDLPPQLEPRMLELARDRREAVRLHATRALKWFRASGHAFERLLTNLQDEAWVVRGAAIEALLHHRRKASIEPLIRQMQREDGRLRMDIAETLAQLTGEDFGPLPRTWELWWNGGGQAQLMPSVEAAQEIIAEKRAKRAAAAEGQHTGTYHGLPVPPGKLVFILDISGSMDTRLDRERTYYQYFARALIDTLSGLPESTHFELILFEGRVRPWRGRLEPATAQNVGAARSHLTQTYAQGATNLYGALEQALSMDGVETIFLMTDGEPTAGERISHGDILAGLTDLNRDRRIRIHTIAAGTANAEFLEQLAQAHGGEMVDLTDLRHLRR